MMFVYKVKCTDVQLQNRVWTFPGEPAMTILQTVNN